MAGADEHPQQQRRITIANIYYAHGLKCATYPAAVITIAAVVVVVCSLPFFITTTGDVNSPKSWRSSWFNYRVSTPSLSTPSSSRYTWIINNASLYSDKTPSWFLGLPSAVVQQMYIHTEVDCSDGDSSEICSHSLYAVARTTSALLMKRLVEVANVCAPVLHPAAVSLAHLYGNRGHAPKPLSFASSILSPLLDLIPSSSDSSGSDDFTRVRANLSLHTLKELLYGGFWEQSHIHHGALSQEHSTREFTFAVTLMLSATEHNFYQLQSCIDGLDNLWSRPSQRQKFVNHLFYESSWTLREFAPLLSLYSIVFMYITFSVGKIELVRSKFGLGFTAVVTVIASLTMSLGICTFFGLSITVSGSEIYPFVVVVIGLENILVIVKAVISTDPELDVKFRIAEGLKKEGRSITNNLITEVCVILLGVITFNYAMKEFCIIALVGLMCDFFLQIVFFPTVLFIDLRRMELTDLKRIEHSNARRSSTHRRSIPKREKVNTFLARGRLVQRALMFVVVVYLISWFSHTELYQSMLSSTSDPAPSQHHPHHSTLTHAQAPSTGHAPSSTLPWYGNQSADQLDHFDSSEWGVVSERGKVIVYRSDEDGFEMKCGEDMYCWRPMATTHWPRLLRLYNNTLSNRFITLLPPVMLNYRLGFTPEKLFARSSQKKGLLYILHTTLVAVLSLPNVIKGIIVLFVCGVGGAYLMVLWWEAKQQLIRELKGGGRGPKRVERMYAMKGHTQDINCLCVNGGFVFTASMDGFIRVWDLTKRDCCLCIDRREVTEHQLRQYGDTISRHVEGCEFPDQSSTTAGSKQHLQTIAASRRQSVPARTFSPNHDTRSICSSSSLPNQQSASQKTPSSLRANVPVLLHSSLIGGTAPDTASIHSRQSAESISLSSYDTAEFSPLPVQGKDEAGFNYKEHFSFFSQFTANLALEHSQGSPEDQPLCQAAPIWCMDVRNGTIAIGCGNGQIEVWNGISGVLQSCLSAQLPGVTTLCLHHHGVLSGHVDGSLNLMGLQGLMTHCVRAHKGPVSVLLCSAYHVITGGYDHLVKAHRIVDFTCDYTLHCHKGHITAGTLSESKDHCVTACSGGVVCYWKVNGANIIHELEGRGQTSVLRVELQDYFIAALFNDGCLQLWDRVSGWSIATVELNGYTHDFVALSDTHVALALHDCIVVYNTRNRREVRRKQLDILGGVALIRHMTTLDSSTLVCSTGHEVLLAPTGLKPKNE